MLGLSPEELMAVLRTAATTRPDARLDEVLGEFRRRWLAIALRRRPELRDDAEDAVQAGLIDLLHADTLDSLREPALLEHFAGGLFWNKLRAVARSRRREIRRRGPSASSEEDLMERLSRIVASADPTPEDLASARERLAIVRECLEGLEIARAKFVEGLADRDLATRFAKSHDAIRNHLKRVRQMLRIRLAEGG